MDAKGNLGPEPGSPSAINMAYLKLRNWEYRLHELLMNTSMNQLPENLQEKIRVTCKEIGMCGDVIAVVIADWIRTN